MTANTAPYVVSIHTHRSDFAEPIKVAATDIGVEFVVGGTLVKLRTDAAESLRDALDTALSRPAGGTGNPRKRRAA